MWFVESIKFSLSSLISNYSDAIRDFGNVNYGLSKYVWISTVIYFIYLFLMSLSFSNVNINNLHSLQFNEMNDSFKNGVHFKVKCKNMLPIISLGMLMVIKIIPFLWNNVLQKMHVKILLLCDHGFSL